MSHDPELLGEFIAEAEELLDQLDQGMARLQQQGAEPALLDELFRSLHTIKGSSSFLDLKPITEFAHVAEDALNHLRTTGGEQLGEKTIEHLPHCCDLLRSQMEQLAAGQDPERAPEELLRSLRAIGASPPEQTTASPAPGAALETGEGEAIVFSSAQADLLPHLLEDLRAGLDEIDQRLDEAEQLERVGELAGELARSIAFLQVEHVEAELGVIGQAGVALSELPEAARCQALPRVRALIELMRRRAERLEQHRLLEVDASDVIEALQLLLDGQTLPGARCVDSEADWEAVLAADGVCISGGGKPSPTDQTEAEEVSRGESSQGGGQSSMEPTLRVDVSRLESLVNLVGELVLQKNRLTAFTRRMTQRGVPHGLVEEAGRLSSELNRVTGELQTGIMKTRLQPLSKLFNRYPRIVRDLARQTGKKIELAMEGGDTEVDKSVIEALADPMVHLLRNSADHGIESPEARERSGKPAMGTITLMAHHQGTHVRLEVRDDGGGIDPSKLAEKAVARGLVSEDELKTMSEQQILQLVFTPGFSTSDGVSDLSGRGVGMDVVRNNITRLNGMIEVRSTVGEGTCFSIDVPLTVAIMPAMMVAVDQAQYALPLSNLLEIVRPEEAQAASVQRQPVIRWRDEIVPLVDLGDIFEHRPASAQRHFAAVVGIGEQRVGLLIDHPIGHQEVVIKPLDGEFSEHRAISAATVREDGEVSLIVDIAGLVRHYLLHQKAA